MWIFSKTGFLSIVQDRNNKKNLLVRSRFAGDIEAIFGEDFKVKETRDADYRFRSSIPRGYVATIMAGIVGSIDYPNFKDSVKDPGRHGDYMRVWGVMHAAQERRRLDAKQMREMLRAMQYGEITVSCGVELIDMWLAGNYSDDQLPPVRDLGLGEDDMPADVIEKLRAALSDLLRQIEGCDGTAQLSIDQAEAALKATIADDRNGKL